MVSAGRLAVLLGLLFGLTRSSTLRGDGRAPQMAADLGVPASTAVWSVSGYAVALAVATAAHGRLADMVGIRVPLCLGVSAMALGAVAAALAPTFAVLAVARVLQGLGAAAVPVLAVALVSVRTTGSAQAAALGRVAGVSATLSALGPLAGGALEAGGDGAPRSRCRSWPRRPCRCCGAPRRPTAPASGSTCAARYSSRRPRPGSAC